MKKYTPYIRYFRGVTFPVQADYGDLGCSITVSLPDLIYILNVVCRTGMADSLFSNPSIFTRCSPQLKDPEKG